MGTESSHRFKNNLRSLNPNKWVWACPYLGQEPFTRFQNWNYNSLTLGKNLQKSKYLVTMGKPSTKMHDFCSSTMYSAHYMHIMYTICSESMAYD